MSFYITGHHDILDEANEKLWIALQKKDLTALSVAQAMIEIVHKKIASFNTDMVQIWKKKQKTRNCLEKETVIYMLREGPVAKM